MKRKDGRKPDEMRPIVMKAGVIPNANGSGYVSMGKTTAIVGVYGPQEMHPRRFRKSERTVLKTIYNMLPFSTEDRCRPGPSRRSREISKVIRNALEPAIYLKEFPKTAIEIYINITQANAGTRTAAVNAASIALADAGIPMRDLVASVAAGQIDGTPVLDLKGKEEDATVCDLPIAYMPRLKKVTLMQLDGNLSPKDLSAVTNLAIKGAEKLYEMQKKALKKRWME